MLLNPLFGLVGDSSPSGSAAVGNDVDGNPFQEIFQGVQQANGGGQSSGSGYPSLADVIAETISAEQSQSSGDGSQPAADRPQNPGLERHTSGHPLQGQTVTVQAEPEVPIEPGLTNGVTRVSSQNPVLSEASESPLDLGEKTDPAVPPTISQTELPFLEDEFRTIGGNERPNQSASSHSPETNTIEPAGLSEDDASVWLDGDASDRDGSSTVPAPRGQVWDSQQEPLPDANRFSYSTTPRDRTEDQSLSLTDDSEGTATTPVDRDQVLDKQADPVRFVGGVERSARTESFEDFVTGERGGSNSQVHTPAPQAPGLASTQSRLSEPYGSSEESSRLDGSNIEVTSPRRFASPQQNLFGLAPEATVNGTALSETIQGQSASGESESSGQVSPSIPSDANTDLSPRVADLLRSMDDDVEQAGGPRLPKQVNLSERPATMGSEQGTALPDARPSQEAASVGPGQTPESRIGTRAETPQIGTVRQSQVDSVRQGQAGIVRQSQSGEVDLLVEPNVRTDELAGVIKGSDPELLRKDEPQVTHSTVNRPTILDRARVTADPYAQTDASSESEVQLQDLLPSSRPEAQAISNTPAAPESGLLPSNGVARGGQGLPSVEISDQQAPPPTDVEESKVTNQIVRGARFLTREGANQVTLRLDPPELGEITIRLSSVDKVLSGEIRVESRMVQEIVNRNMAELRESLGNQGIQVDNIEVSVESGGRSNVDRDGSAASRREEADRDRNPASDRDSQTRDQDESQERRSPRILNDGEVDYVV